MMDYLISDLMKKIWMEKEFEMYKVFKFWGFSWIF